jgi:hypothetical protein
MDSFKVSEDFNLQFYKSDENPKIIAVLFHAQSDDENDLAARLVWNYNTVEARDKQFDILNTHEKAIAVFNEVFAPIVDSTPSV